jgi:hypothetical protein
MPITRALGEQQPEHDNAVTTGHIDFYQRKAIWKPIQFAPNPLTTAIKNIEKRIRIESSPPKVPR